MELSCYKKFTKIELIAILCNRLGVWIDEEWVGGEWIGGWVDWWIRGNANWWGEVFFII